MPGRIQPRSDNDNSKAKTVLINPKINVDFVALHANSSKETIESILAMAKDGVILAGDWNISLSDDASDETQDSNLKRLKKYLDDHDLKIEISDEDIKKINYVYKERSKASEFNQQGLKGGVPSGGTKDAAFKFVKKKKKGERSIPVNLENRLKQIDVNVKKFKKKIGELENQGKLTTTRFNMALKRAEMINFLDAEQSHYNDHLSVSYYDAQTNTICYAMNTIEHTEYNFAKHFKIGVTPEEVAEAYLNYIKAVFTAIYALVMKRDGIDPSTVDFANLTTEQHVEKLRKLLRSAFDNNARGKAINDGIDLTAEDIENCVNSILGAPAGNGKAEIAVSAEFARINNDLLVDRFTPEEIAERKAALFSNPADLKNGIPQFLDEDRLAVGNVPEHKGIGKLERLVNVFFQGLAIKQPGENEKTVSFRGNGFPAFLDENKKVMSVAAIEEKQIAQMKKELRELHTKHPTAAISVALIEGKGQHKKIREMRDCVNALNAEAKLQRERNNNYYFYLNVGLAITASAGSLAGAIIAGLALAGIMTIVTAGVAGILVGAVVAGLVACSLFANSSNYRNQDTGLGMSDNVIGPEGPIVVAAAPAV